MSYFAHEFKQEWRAEVRVKNRLPLCTQVQAVSVGDLEESEVRRNASFSSYRGDWGIAEQAVGQNSSRSMLASEKYPATARIRATLRMPKKRTQEVCFI